jgi:Protein of unknown function (DUF3040)
MLSDYELRELALIEKGLAEEDRRLAESLRPRDAKRVTPWTRRRWMSRALLGFGVLLLVVGLLTSADGVFMQGLLFGGGGVFWLRWQSRSKPTPPAGARQRRSSDGRPA